MSLSIFIREADMLGYITSTAPGPQPLSLTLSDGLKFPNPHAAQEAFDSLPAKFKDGLRFEMVAADPDDATREPRVIGELETFESIPRVPLGALSLYAEIKRSSKYFGQFRGLQPVTHVIPPSYGDAYCWRVAHNAYRHEDLTFAIKVGGEFVRLDKWIAPKAERRAA